ncbi:MAG: hypothetical protein JWQ76_2039, partial [Ramlibacter sp.]|nr:hypothetical protein [Ramlibacter sp.]
MTNIGSQPGYAATAGTLNAMVVTPSPLAAATPPPCML